MADRDEFTPAGDHVGGACRAADAVPRRWSGHRGQLRGAHRRGGGLLLVSEEAAAELGLRPSLRLVGFACGRRARADGAGPVPATKRVLEQAGLTIDDVGLFEPRRAVHGPGADGGVTKSARVMPNNPEENSATVQQRMIMCGHPLTCTPPRKHLAHNGT